MPTDLTKPAPTLTYGHRPKPFAAELEMELTAHELIATRGRSSLRFPLTAVEKVELVFSPRNTAHHAFSCRVRATDGRSVIFDSLSWKSLIETERQDEAYTRFVRAVVSRARAHNTNMILQAGVAPFKFWGMFSLGIPVMAGLAGIAAYAFASSGVFSGFLAIALFVYLGWWLRDYLRRNRPAIIPTDEIPARVLPHNGGTSA
ncbi:hypothetical protein MCEMSEM23_01937 [Rhabdaerophilaceae bacterium]